ncbi:MAG: GNAT family N-acetyltransferase [Candidatus Schekmanbacteria bacterium]|nr:MAG: GNAT family N-acetyltransferase [Candidatus Schekmanbacteria bacterium]
MKIPLRDNAVIAVIGGGPSGAAFAIRLLRKATEIGKKIDVIIFEGKDFKIHYNQCVGVLSPPLMDILEKELLVELPPSLYKRSIHGYRLHGGNKEVLLFDRGTSGMTITVRRVEFDRFLLDTALNLGARLIRSRVINIEFFQPEEKNGEVRIYSESGYTKADCVVGAFGLDSTLLSVLENVTKKSKKPYKRPKKMLKTFITKFHADPVFLRKYVGNIIYAYLKPPEIPRIEFAAISPKGDHIIINIAGEKVTSLDMDMFLSLKDVKEHLPSFNPSDLSYFEGRFPTSPSKNPYGDRYVCVGDVTGWMRPFKGKGINVAITTGMRAADAIIEGGIGNDSFSKYEESCKELLDDYIYGAFVRFLCIKASRLFVGRMIQMSLINPIIYDALFDSVSGHRPYKEIIKSLIKPELASKEIISFIKKLLRGKRKMGEIKIRNLARHDIEAIVKIDEKITGRPHEAYWTGKISKYLASEPGACLAAEIEGKVVGFVLGDIRGWEYAVPTCGWLDVIGVDVEYQGMGIGKKLIEALFSFFKKSGIENVVTMVNWNEADLIDYFRSQGFERGEYINMIKKL